jgi:hypothetical protein
MKLGEMKMRYSIIARIAQELLLMMVVFCAYRELEKKSILMVAEMVLFFLKKIIRETQNFASLQNINGYFSTNFRKFHRTISLFFCNK